mmetsp:Transcript_41300/g.84474  ORF Transcript_41300/g.84474 Transcript_41300/m.84474 type:complete len:218 (-) Transcript_41300:355-1008(-)
MWSWEICEICSSPETPPMSTNAPYGLSERTIPVMSWPGSRLVRRLSTTARRLETTRRFFAWSTSRNLRGTMVPTASSLSPCGAWEPGRNPRRPSKFTSAPPRLIDMISAVMVQSSSWIWRTRSQARANSRRRMESLTWPFSSSPPMIWNSRLSPMDKYSSISSTRCMEASAEFKNALDLPPTSTRAPFCSYCTTCPTTVSPTWNEQSNFEMAVSKSE